MKVTKHNECFHCCHRCPVPVGMPRGQSTMVKCTKPDESVRGDRTGVRKGRFDYPRSFDPIWKKTFCRNFQESKKDDTRLRTAPEVVPGTPDEAGPDRGN